MLLSEALCSKIHPDAETLTSGLYHSISVNVDSAQSTGSCLIKLKDRVNVVRNCCLLPGLYSRCSNSVAVLLQNASHAIRDSDQLSYSKEISMDYQTQGKARNEAIIHLLPFYCREGLSFFQLLQLSDSMSEL